jgi:hypothetical protein
VKRSQHFDSMHRDIVTGDEIEQPTVRRLAGSIARA